MSQRADLLGHLRVELVNGTRPRQVLMTLMADYWLDEGARVPSATLVDLMSDFQVSESGARTLLSRQIKQGRLEAARDGRRTFYQLTRPTRIRLADGLEQMKHLGSEEPQGEIWTSVAFSVAEDRRGDRHKLREGLSWLGFAPLYDGIWISPRPARRQASELISKLGIKSASVFEGTVARIGTGHGNPTDAWDLPRIQGLYQQFIEAADPLAAEAEAGRIDARDALVIRTELINVWRGFPHLDPGLPAAMLPEGWLREDAKRLFEHLYDALGDGALERVRGAVAAQVPECLGFISAHSFGRQGAL